MKETIRVVGALLERPDGPGHYLITQRTEKACFPLLWEFPGGRLHDGEREIDGLKRELYERFAISVQVKEQAMCTTHDYEHRSIVFTVFFCSMDDASAPVDLSRVNDAKWVALKQMDAYTFPPADEKTLSQLLDL